MAAPPPFFLSRRFAPLFCCQFFAAFNDNFLKTALVFLILFHVGGGNAAALITLASAIFISPFFFMSGLAGELADRHDKARLAQWTKFSEMFVAALAALGYLQQSLPLLFVAVFGFGVLAALFGPVKYGLLPDQLRREELPAANALIEGATFIAILISPAQSPPTLFRPYRLRNAAENRQARRVLCPSSSARKRLWHSRSSFAEHGSAGLLLLFR